MFELPNDVIREIILKHLDVTSVMRLSQTSKYNRGYIENSEHLWKRLFMRDFSCIVVPKENYKAKYIEAVRETYPGTLIQFIIDGYEQKVMKTFDPYGAEYIQSCLTYALEHSHIHVAELIRARCQLTNNTLVECLHKTIANNNNETTHYLVTIGAPITLEVISMACTNRYLPTLEYILKHPSGSGKIVKALIIHKEGYDLDLVQLYLEHYPKDGHSIMATACAYGFLELLNYMIERGETNFITLLLIAAQHCHVHIVKRLLQLNLPEYEIEMARDKYPEIMA
jgi:F-box domain